MSPGRRARTGRREGPTFRRFAGPALLLTVAVVAAACAAYRLTKPRRPASPVTAVRVVVLGDADTDVVAAVAPAVASAFGAPCTIVPGAVPLPPEGYTPQRRQYLAARLLEVLRPLAAAPGERVLGVTNADIYEGDWNFLFGLSDLPGPVSVMSLARLRPRHGAPAEAHRVLSERACRIAIHELGHAGGLPHCATESCVMHFSISAAGVDLTSRRFDARCRRGLRQR